MGPAHQGLLDTGPLQQPLGSTLHGDSQPVERCPAPEVLIAAMPVAHKCKCHCSGEQCPQQATLGPTQWNIHIPGERRGCEKLCGWAEGCARLSLLSGLTLSNTNIFVEDTKMPLPGVCRPNLELFSTSLILGKTPNLHRVQL